MKTTRIMINLLIVLMLIAGVLLLPSRSTATTGNTTSDLQVIPLLEQTTGSFYVELQGTMSGIIQREDGSQGSYKVPVTFLYPQNQAICNGVGILDLINSVFYETFDFAGTPSDPFNPSLFPLARMNLGDEFIENHGYVYAQAQWNKLVIDRQTQAGETDPSLHIDRGQDGYLILRDLSHVLRNPEDFVISGLEYPVCAANNVIGFGYSQTGMLLRQFYFSGLNTKLALSSDFDDGLVFEGSLHAVPGSHCRVLTDQYPFYSYSFNGCGAETPKNQGKVITINTETDVQMTNGWKARPAGNGSKDHYRLYELAGSSHISSTLFPFKFFGIRGADMADQNYADTAPVFRAMLEHLRTWINQGEDPPANVFIDGQTGMLNTPLFSSDSWGSDNVFVRLPKYGADGNVLGGVRLPHIRTILPNGQEVGAPLGIFRGVECNNSPIQNTYMLDCQLNGDPNIYNMSGGTFIPFTELDSTFCGIYDNYESYLNSVLEGAAFAVSQGWILPDETPSILANAAQKAQDYPGCVPPFTP